MKPEAEGARQADQLTPILDSERVVLVPIVEPPPLPTGWVKVDDSHLPELDDICIVWARQAPWELPDLMLTRGWWVVENSDTLTGAAERQAKRAYFSQEPWLSGMTTQALYFAVLKEAERLHGWEPGAKTFRKTGEQPI